ncbi:hypothetical protein F3J45_05595 [Pantoea sp. Ap-967]|uniref:hypothetical protein n=1 Tax=Pantoea sp. Ap-967 TaxID=2608362 RepID=UPI00142038A7|nr:hypothetical protein [Pantoea sp. Ap-967]NIE73918.1 hypothetical protein [Pantoea sp. Ap-967]
MEAKEFNEFDRLERAVENKLPGQTFDLLCQLVCCRGEVLGDRDFALVERALSDCLLESQIIDFHARCGEIVRRTGYSSRYMELIAGYKGLRFSDESRNVIVGENGYLYLAGGRHSVLDYITGRKSPPLLSIENFRDNLKRREGFCKARNIKYKHIIFPDKQSVESSNFPLLDYTCLGDRYAEKCIDLAGSLMYPKRDLGSGSFHKKDTHMSDSGYCNLTALLLRSLGFDDRLCEAVKQELIGCLTKHVKYSGDLGSKMDPEEFDVKNDIEPNWSYLHVKNNLGVSNDGLAELYFNENALTGMRVIIFGDSFSRLHSLFLSRCFKEIAFFRTRYFHEDLVDMARPDLVITGNAERYLGSVDRDDIAPNFFLYPLLKGIGHAPDQEYAIAMNAFLSYGKPEYNKFKDKLRADLF